jgi:hypothetical protein
LLNPFVQPGIAARRILASRDRFQVSGIAAGRIAAEMVDLMAERYRPLCGLKRYPVSIQDSLPIPYLAVALIVLRALPNSTSAFIGYAALRDALSKLQLIHHVSRC